MADTMSAETYLEKFAFKGQRVGANWSEETRANFIRVTKYIHELGWDFYWVGKGELRFGRKIERDDGSLRSAAGRRLPNLRCGTINFVHSHTKPPFLRYTKTFSAGNADLSNPLPTSFEEYMRSVSPPKGNRDEPVRSITREAYWPNETEPEADEEFDAEDEGADRGDAVGDPPKPTNLILYGPPGTGKTYATRERCVALIDGGLPASGQTPAEKRKAIRQRYRELEEARQIEFVTFHQSYGYEDFVEGLRPEMPGEGQAVAGFRLSAQPGVFRRIADRAENERLKIEAPSASALLAPNGEHVTLEGHRVFKMSLGRAGIEDEIFAQAMQDGYAALGWGGEIDWSDPKFQDYNNLAMRWREQPGQENVHGGKGDIRQLWCFLTMSKGDLIIVSQGNSLVRAIGVVAGDYYFEPNADDGYFHRRKVDWLVLPKPLPVSEISETGFTQTSCYRIADASLKKSAIERLLAPQPDTARGADAKPRQYVLIIDEINRANISKVFGELITLIEPDKRLGADEELTVTLPYSGKKFGVPSNLHIVGTMNTADRSIALLDTALRRRFEFEELMPRPNLLEICDGIDLPALLTAINRRIEYYLDREHQIGHAFFLQCRSKSDVDAVMARKVIPLLCEYFFEDYGRVADVLGQTDRSAGFFDLVDLRERGQSRASWRVKPPEQFDREAYGVATGAPGRAAAVTLTQAATPNVDEAGA